MHGGAKGTGAPKGNSNAFKHGEYTAENLAIKKEFSEKLSVLLDNSKALIEKLKNN